MRDEDDFFEHALNYVFKNEGDFVNDADDAGGATKYGITLDTLSMWRGRPASVKDVESLTTEAAESLYYNLYWEPLGCDKLTQLTIAIALFDAGVLFGIGISAVYAQTALAQSGFSDIIKIDGHVGPKTIAALNSVKAALFIKAFHLLFTLRIADIITRYPRNAKYRNGWENRVDRYLQLTV